MKDPIWNVEKTEQLEKAPARPSPGASLLRVTERIRTTTGDVHPGWIRATSILLRGMERLNAHEAAQPEDGSNIRTGISPVLVPVTVGGSSNNAK